MADVVATSYDAFTPGNGVHRVDETAMYGQRIRYEDLVGAVDVVASKPGYGIISECAANGTALLYTDRGRFCEYDVLVREMPRYLEAAFIGQEDLLAGRWRDAVAGLLARPPRPPAPAEGATTAADWLSARLDRRLAQASLTVVMSDQIRGTLTFSIDFGWSSAWARNAGRSRSDLKPMWMVAGDIQRSTRETSGLALRK